ncbi:MAG: hypothetical protein E7582_03935 [Ruminococcaceae bacterium]|nr:hypothetical protein [Oscillospiraceae bacterium]
MKKYLFNPDKKFFKANLHSHSTVSDGKYTPEELKKIYMDKGYSVFAYTDHEVFVPHNELSDENFLALNGYEYELIEEKSEEKPTNRVRKACHLCLIAKESDVTRQVCWHGRVWGNALQILDKLDYDRENPPYIPVYSGEGITDVIQTAKKAGFFVTYNHPAWSLEDMADIAECHGMDALEIYNTNTAIRGWEAYCPYIYESMVRRGERIGCIAADDCHRDEHFFGGFTMISASDLNYRTITKALEDGDYYASTGPEIKELYFEDGRIYVKTNMPITIKANYGSRYAEMHHEVSETSFPVREDDIFVRITLIDEKGKCANTRAYFIDELYN